MGKLSLYARKRIVNLHFRGENVSQITRKIRDEDAIVASRPAVSLFLKRYKATGSLCDRPRKGRGAKLSIPHFNAIDEAMEANDELSALELSRIIQERFHIAVSAQTVRRVRRKLGWRWSGTKYCQLVKDVNKPKRVHHCLNILYNGDTFNDVIFTDECSVKIERYTRRSFHKVGQQRRVKGQPKHPLKVRFCFFNPSLTRFVRPFPYLDIPGHVDNNNKMAARMLMRVKRILQFKACAYNLICLHFYICTGSCMGWYFRGRCNRHLHFRRKYG